MILRERWLYQFAVVVLSIALVSTGGVVRAADGPYLDLSLGGGTLRDLDDSEGFTSEFWPGSTISGAFGFKRRWLRLEGELFYAHFALKDQTGPGGERPAPPPPLCFLCGTSDINGDLTALALMANAYFDLDLTDRTRLLLGGGIGTAQVSADYEFDVLILGLPTDDSIDVVDDQDSVLAYQAKVGFAFDVTAASEIYLGYRFFATEDLSFDFESGGKLEQDGLGAHIGEVGFRYHF